MSFAGKDLPSLNLKEGVHLTLLCRNCIVNWLQRQHYCFNCKTPVGSKELIRSTFMDHICQSYTNLFQILRQDNNASIESDHTVRYIL